MHTTTNPPGNFMERPVAAMILAGLCGGLLTAAVVALSYERQISHYEKTIARLESNSAEMRGRQEGYLAAIKSLQEQRTIVVTPQQQIPAHYPTAPMYAPAVAQAAPTQPVAPAQPEKIAEKTVKTTETTAGKTGNKVMEKKALQPSVVAAPKPKAEESVAEAAALLPQDETKTVVNDTEKETISAVTVMPDVLPAENGLRGQVLSREPRHKRVMINLGSGDALKAGDLFTLWRDSQYIGEVRVKTVLRNMSSCEVLTVMADGIRVGDTVQRTATDKTMAEGLAALPEDE